MGRETGMNVYQFASDETILIFNYTSKNLKVVNIVTEEECDFLSGVYLGDHAPFILGPYANCFVDGKLYAYE